MFDLSKSECLFYGGIVMMAVTVVLAIAGIVVFITTGRRLKRTLEEEYGKPLHIQK